MTERLHQDLRPWLEEVGDMPVLRHPLVYAVPYFDAMAPILNQQYEAKVEAVAQARLDGAHRLYVFLHERPHRLGALLDLEPELGNAEYWDLVGDVWSDTENARQNYGGWRRMLTSDRPGRALMMAAEDHERLASLPDEFPAFRGGSAEHVSEGFSWTLDRGRAEWFAKRFVREGERPAVCHGTVLKVDVIALFLGRGEDEIIVMPEDVRGKRLERL